MIKLNEEEIKFLQEWYPKLGIKYCAEKLNMPKHTIKERARHLKLRTLSKEKRLCPKCLINNCSISIKLRLCEPCFKHYRHTVHKKYHMFKPIKPRGTDIDRRLQHLATIIRSRNKNIYNISENITKEDLQDLFNKQNGKCFYSNRTMKIMPNTHKDFELISVDRINSNYGYTKENIVLTIWGVNKIKNNLDKDYFISLCQDISETHRL